MMEKYITLDTKTLSREHICCAFSDKKCTEGYALKKAWLGRELSKGFLFRRLDARAKVFIEYGPAESCWMPIDAPNYLALGCFWVSGQYKGKGHGQALLRLAMDEALAQRRDGLVAVVGTKKFHFMSDTKWLLRQGFVECARVNSGFSLLVLKFNSEARDPAFNSSAIEATPIDASGIVVYYSNRCPFTEYYVQTILPETAHKRALALRIIKLESMEQAQQAPVPATIFALFLEGKFITTDLSVCLDSRFDRITGYTP